jgi:hypothetical protein
LIPSSTETSNSTSTYTFTNSTTTTISNSTTTSTHTNSNRRYEMITQAVAGLLPLLKEAGIYRRWLLFWRRFDKKFEEGMLEYIRNHYREKFSNEFPGCPEELVPI